MKNTTIKARLWTGAAMFLAFYILMWILSYYTSLNISSNLDPSKVDVMRQADQLHHSLTDVEQKLNEAAQSKEPDLVADASRRAEDFKKAVAKLRAVDETNRADYDLVEKEFDRYFISAREASIAIIREGELTGEVLALAREMNESLPPLRRDVDKITDRSYNTFSALLDKSVRSASLLVTQNFVVLISVVMLWAIIFPMIIRSIILPIEKLVYATNELAQGNLETQAEVSRMDEIGVLAVSFNRMARALKDKNAALEKTTSELKTSLEIRKEMQKRIVEANRDLTAANARLMEADRLKSDFLASMSHELRTPLNAIINFTDQIIEDWDYLEKDKKWAGEAKEMLTRVYKSSRHLLSLINDLLDLAKIESGHMGLDLAQTDLREIVAESIASVSSLAKAKGLELKSTAPAQLAQFTLDERRVLQILINLLSNAIKFTETGSVTVKIETPQDYPEGALIKVVDTGVGIPESYLSVIFDRFRQVDGGDSRKHAGTGLGLNLVKELAELHGGSVKVESEVGKGSTFIVHLPFVASETKNES